MPAVPAADGNPEELLATLLPDIVEAIRKACRHYSVDPSEVEAFYHEIILLLIEDDYRRLQSFRWKSSRQTWLTAIARHYVSRRISQEKKAMSLDEASADCIACNPIQERELISKEREGNAREAISRLTAREQQLFALLCRDDLTSDEIAKKMGIKLDSLYRRKHSLVKKLRKALKESRAGWASADAS